jgi:maltooligosyltrehalose trehalohydrolase
MRVAQSERRLGAMLAAENTCSFLVWAPRAKKVEVHITSPNERIIAMQSSQHGYFYADVSNVSPGTLYRYRLDGKIERPDPASRFQPQGVHGPSQVLDNHFPWTDDAWHGLPLDKYVVYELHVGTFTPKGTFDAIIPRIAEIGVTTASILTPCRNLTAARPH